MNQFSHSHASMHDQDENVPDIRSPDYGIRPRRRFILLAIAFYCFTHLLLVTFGPPLFPDDAAKQLLLSQSFQLSYGIDNPPLLTWVYAAANAVTGLPKHLYYVLHYLIMGIGLVFYYFAARIVFQWYDSFSEQTFRRNDLSAAALGSWALISMTGWFHHEERLTAVALFALQSASIFFFARAIMSEKLRDWAGFGLTAGLGFLTHYSHILLIICMVRAALTIPALTKGWVGPDDEPHKARLRFVNLGLAMTVALIVVAPFIWQTINMGVTLPELSGNFSQYVKSPDASIRGPLSLRWTGMSSFISALITYTTPLLPVFATLFWPLWLPKVVPFFPKRKVEEDESDIVWRQFTSRTLMLGLVSIIVLVLLGADEIDLMWMHPVLAVLPIWLFLQVQRAGPYFVSMRAFLVVTIGVIALTAAARPVLWRQAAPNCIDEQCDNYLPVHRWSVYLKDQGWVGGTLVGAEYSVTGNLKPILENTRVLNTGFDYNIFPAPRAERGACLAVWRDSPIMPDNLVLYLTEELGVTVADRTPQDAIWRKLVLSPEKASVLYYSFLEPTDRCR